VGYSGVVVAVTTKTLGRRPNAVPTSQLSVMLPVDLRLRVELRLLDPAADPPKVKHGAWSLLLQSLLYEWLQRQGEEPVKPVAGPGVPCQGGFWEAGPTLGGHGPSEAICSVCKRPTASHASAPPCFQPDTGFLDLLDEVHDYFAAREDTRDGDDGQPRPNEEMTLLMRLREYIPERP
jgi:hypothetical protein